MYRRRGPFQSNNSNEDDDISNFDWNEEFGDDSDDSYDQYGYVDDADDSYDDYADEDGYVDDADDDSYDASFNDFDQNEQFDDADGNADFVEEYYEDTAMSPANRSHRPLRRIWIFVIALLLVVFILFVALLFWFTNSEEPGTYVSLKNQSWVAEVSVRRTGYNHPQLFVKVRYLGSGNRVQMVCGIIKGDTFSLRADWIEFVGNQVNGFRWAATNGQLSSEKCSPNRTAQSGQTAQQSNATLGGGDDTLFNIVSHLPSWWLFGSTTQPFTMQGITSTKFLNYNLYLSTDGVLTHQKIQ